MTRSPGKGSLFSRIFFHGLVVLVASVAAFVLLSALFVLPKLDRDPRRGGPWLVPHLCESTAAVDRTSDGPQEIIATVYTGGGQLRSTFVHPPLPPVSPGDLPRLRADGVLILPGDIAAYPCPLATGGGYVVLQRPGPPPLNWRPLIGVIGVVILVVALASVPFARSIAKPIERVVAVTKAFGRGDLTARAEVNRKGEVGALATAFNEMAERLERLIRSEQEFLANVSHELRTPLARIRVILETAQEDPRRAHGLLREIGIDLADLEGLVENVMESMRLDMGAMAIPGAEFPVSFRTTQIGTVVLDALERFRRRYPVRHIVLVSGSARDCEDVRADSNLLRRLLDNLLENARKYSDDNSLITVTLKSISETVLVEIRDQGIGIDVADLPRVFTPFFRGDRSRSRDTGGAGLGLSLAKRIVDVHRGSITIDSGPGKGTTVRFSLPTSTST